MDFSFSDRNFISVENLPGFEAISPNSLHQRPEQSDFANITGYSQSCPDGARLFFAILYAAEDIEARAECMEIIRELFRQFMSQLLPEKVRLEQNCIYLEPRITFNEIDRYFFSGAVGAYFQIAVDVSLIYAFTQRNGNWEMGIDCYCRETRLLRNPLNNFDTGEI